jgi:hypothetical protein
VKFASVVLLCTLAAAAHAQPRDRVDSTLPERASRERGERVLDTRPLRDASEARLRDELLRQAEIDALIDARQARAAGLVPVYPAVFPSAFAPVHPPVPPPVYPPMYPPIHQPMHPPGSPFTSLPGWPGPGPCTGPRCLRPLPPTPR